MIPRPWRAFPSHHLPILLELRWQTDEYGSKSAKTAALMIYIALIFVSAETVHESLREQETIATLDDLELLTGISRPKLIEGLDLLTMLGVVTVEGTPRKRLFKIEWIEKVRWYKVPCRVHIDNGVIKPFADFSLRKRMELDALKLFLYLANVRSSLNSYAMANYDTIHDKAHVSRPQIRRALVFMTLVRLIGNVHRENDGGASHYGPNQYFLEGYRDLFAGTKPISDSAVVN